MRGLMSFGSSCNDVVTYKEEIPGSRDVLEADARTFGEILRQSCKDCGHVHRVIERQGSDVNEWHGVPERPDMRLGLIA